MAEYYSSVTETGVASGTNKTLINLFATGTPTSRAKLYELVTSSVATPADQAAKFNVGRTTAVGTEGSGYVPNNLDSAGPAGNCDTGIGHSVEPTYTASKTLLVFSMNQRATFRWIANPGAEMLVPATANNGLGIRTASSTSTQVHECSIFFLE